ncbi:hypothetical protein SADUNF_Sadunf14G0010500 [Salix dunnii]|uniref:ARM repeat N-terminal plant domain-containing protein n=1 Tax=Salix dunnii TaxID=1413687 RepID=A0A835JHL0_9ROSI|nr:hypothetical protein SADUNF_Sadunf14G0010500 [Salix dunnii]
MSRKVLIIEVGLLKDKNIYIPYYTAQITGSYTMNKLPLALKWCAEILLWVKDAKMRMKYHSNLLIEGVGGLDMENRKAEEWARQLQCRSLCLLNCLAFKERSLNLLYLDTWSKVIEVATLFLGGLVELRSLCDQSNVGEAITGALLFDDRQSKLGLMNSDVRKVAQEIWDFK